MRVSQGLARKEVTQDEDYVRGLLARYNREAEERRQEAIKRDPTLQGLSPDEQVRELSRRKAAEKEQRLRRNRLLAEKRAKEREKERAHQAELESYYKMFEGRLRDTDLHRLLRTKVSGFKTAHEASNVSIHAALYLVDPLGRVDRNCVISKTQRVKLKVLIEDSELRAEELRAEERRKADDLSRSQAAASQFACIGQDAKLAGALWHALETMPPTTGYVYLKRWRMPDGQCWFKVGITNDPRRREIEQNVLPVAAETVACVDVGSMDRARAIEALIHQVLDEQRITDANNCELFHLNDQQSAAVKVVLEKLG